MRPFRFLGAASDIVDGRALAETARRAERMGYGALVIPDHLIDQFAPIPWMATVAAATERLRVGMFVLNNDLRHPAVLAQDLASLDVLNGGRLEIGLGAGWNRPEYEQTGIDFQPIGTRVGRLGEAVAVIKGLFADPPFTFQGEHYRITQMDGRPKPIQKPHPPLMIGGGGRRLLTLAGREADIVSLAPRIAKNGRVEPSSLTFAATAEKVDWVRQASADRFDAIELNIYPSTWPAVVTDDARGEARMVAARIKERTGVEMSIDDLLESPHIFVGSIDGLTAKFGELRERLGIGCIMVGEIDPLAPVVERLAGT